METSRTIPRNQFNLWYSLFKESGGRLLTNPSSSVGDVVYVRYSFEDMESCNIFEHKFHLLTTPIVEVLKPRSFLWKLLPTIFSNSFIKNLSPIK